MARIILHVVLLIFGLHSSRTLYTRRLYEGDRMNNYNQNGYYVNGYYDNGHYDNGNYDSGYYGNGYNGNGYNGDDYYGDGYYNNGYSDNVDDTTTSPPPNATTDATNVTATTTTTTTTRTTKVYANKHKSKYEKRSHKYGRKKSYDYKPVPILYNDDYRELPSDYSYEYVPVPISYVDSLKYGDDNDTYDDPYGSKDNESYSTPPPPPTTTTTATTTTAATTTTTTTSGAGIAASGTMHEARNYHGQYFPNVYARDDYYNDEPGRSKGDYFPDEYVEPARYDYDQDGYCRPKHTNYVNDLSPLQRSDFYFRTSYGRSYLLSGEVNPYDYFAIIYSLDGSLASNGFMESRTMIDLQISTQILQIIQVNKYGRSACFVADITSCYQDFNFWNSLVYNFIKEQDVYIPYTYSVVYYVNAEYNLQSFPPERKNVPYFCDGADRIFGIVPGPGSGPSTTMAVLNQAGAVEINVEESFNW